METDRRTAEPVEKFKEGREAELLRNLSQRVRDLQSGMGTNHFNVTLEPNATETTISIDYATSLSQAHFSPQSASAAAAIAAGEIWTECSAGLVTIHHDADPADDRRLGVILHG